MAASIIVKPQIATKIRKLLEKHLVGFPLSHEKSFAVNVLDTLQPQFTQGLPGANKLQTSTDFGMVDIRFQTEGVEYVFGVPWEALPGTTVLEKHKAMIDMPADKFLQNVAADGFYAKQSPGTMIIVPGFAVRISPLKPKASRTTRKNRT